MKTSSFLFLFRLRISRLGENKVGSVRLPLLFLFQNKKYENENNREFWNITMFLHDVIFM
jgi:hypothetical protein